MTSSTFTKILIGIFILILGAIFYVLFLEGSNYNFLGSPSSTSTASVTAEHPSITMQTITDTDPINHLDITATYPQLSGLSNTVAETNINTDIEANVNSMISAFKTNETGNGPVSGPFVDATSTLEITASTTLPATIANVISVRLDQDAMSAGAAHPTSQATVLHYNLSTGVALTLDDLFVGDYLDTLASTTVPILTKSLGSYADQDMISSGASALATNYQNFIVEDNGFLIVFNQYQVAPYVVGEQDVLIPYVSLTTVINPSGPLAPFLH